MNKNQVNPNIKDVLDLFKRDIFLAMNCHAIASVQSFDPTNQTIQATINYSKSFLQKNAVTGIYESVAVNYPVLIDVPVVMIQGGGAYLTMPVAVGDQCLILFNDRDIDSWFKNGSTQQIPPTERLHSFSDGIALIGLRSAINPITPYDSVRAVLGNDTAYVGVGPNLIKVANSLYTLNGLLQELINEIINVTGNASALATAVGQPAIAAALTADIASITATAVKIAGLLE